MHAAATSTITTRLFDALTHAGIWEDDSQVKRMLVEWGPKVPGGALKYRSPLCNKKMFKIAMHWYAHEC
jgi:hypothetical protein